MSQEFNFDIDKIANNTISKTDRTTEIIESTVYRGKPEGREIGRAHV